MKFVIISLKRNILPFFLILFAICLVLFSKTNLIAIRNGLLLWANNVIPSLFPFFVLTELLSHTNLINNIGNLFDKIMKPIFNVPGRAAFAFIMGLISGYPTGSKIVADMRTQGLCSKDEGDRMLSFTNNSGPLFIVSFVGVSLFGDTNTGLLLLSTHIFASITVGIILGKLSAINSNYHIAISTHSTNSCKEKISISNFGKILNNSIQNAITSILMIGGFVVLFSVIISITSESYLLDYLSILLKPILYLFGFKLTFAKPILAGIIEITNGISMVSNIPMKAVSQNIILSAFLLGFGGISVLFQVYGMLGKTDLSIKKYIIGKLLHGTLAAFYTFIALKFIPTLNLDVVQTSNILINTITDPPSFFKICTYIILILVLVFIVFVSFSHKNTKNNHQRNY